MKDLYVIHSSLHQCGLPVHEAPAENDHSMARGISLRSWVLGSNGQFSVTYSTADTT